MATFSVFSASSPQLLLHVAAERYAAEEAAGRTWVLVLPRLLLLRAASIPLLERHPLHAWEGQRLLSTGDLVRHYGHGIQDDRVLTPLQVRQLVSTTIGQVATEIPGAFAGQVVDGRVSEATVRALARLVSELEPRQISPKELERRLIKAAPAETEALSTRAGHVVEVYRRYMERLEQDGYVGPRSAAIRAAEAATTEPPPRGATHICFLGLDGSTPADIPVHFLEALRRNPFVTAVEAGLVLPRAGTLVHTALNGRSVKPEAVATGHEAGASLPSVDGEAAQNGADTSQDTAPAAEEIEALTSQVIEPDDTGWSTHGNMPLMSMPSWAEALREHARVSDDTYERAGLVGMPADLAAVARDPFAFRDDPVPSTGAVRVVRVPDSQMELEWVAADVKRRLLDAVDSDRPLLASDVAIIDRDMRHRADDVARELTDLGLEVATSQEHSISSVPAVRSLILVMRLVAFGWKPSDLLAVAESPYLLELDRLNPTLLERLARQGIAPASAIEWIERARALAAAESNGESGELREVDTPIGVSDLPAEATTTAKRLVDSLESLYKRLGSTLDMGPATGAEWVARLLDFMETVKIEDRIYDGAAVVAPELRGALVRTDIDGTNALIRALQDWARGREISGIQAELLTAADWLSELEAIAGGTEVRLSAYARDAVQLVDPTQAALRSWRVVYIIGLTDGRFPARPDVDEYTLSDSERRAVSLPDRVQRSARERLFFHLAASTAREQLVLVTPAADDRGRALVQSPYIAALSLRIAGLEVEQVTAKSLMPDTPEACRNDRDVALLAVSRYRAALKESQEKGVPLADLVSADPIVGSWLATREAGAVVDQWAVTRLRETLDATLKLNPKAVEESPYRSFVGFLGEDSVPEELRSETAAFTPADISAYKRCHFRYFATRVLGLSTGASREEEPDEAAAFGALQHRILEVLYRGLLRDDLLPPQSETDIASALGRLPSIASSLVQQQLSKSRQALWREDLAFVLDVVRSFVRRDLTAMLDAHTNPESDHIRTRILGLEVPLGTNSNPVTIEAEGETFRLKGTIDRIEEICDPRYPELEGQLIAVDYRSGRMRPYRSPENQRKAVVTEILNGRKGASLQAPLLALLTESYRESPVAQVQVRATSLEADPMPLGDYDARVAGKARGGRVLPVRHPEVPKDEGVLATAVETAARHAGSVVGSIRAGHFVPQPGRDCYGCPLREVCRAGMRAGHAGEGRPRAMMPLAVTRQELAAARSRASAGSSDDSNNN